MIRSLATSWITIIGSSVLAGVAFGEDAPGTDITAAEVELHTVEQKADSLLAAREVIILRADDLATRITELRRQDELSQAEHRALEAHLRDSQALQEQLHLIDTQVQAQEARRQVLVDDLIRAIQHQIDLTLQAIESADTGRDQELTGHLQILIGKKEVWEARRMPRYRTVVTAYPIDAQPTDSPRQLRMKGDILSDREEAVRQEIQAVDERIHSLREEMRIRQKVRELASELELFDEREELLGRSSVTEAAAPFDDGEQLDYPSDSAVRASLTADPVGTSLLPGISQAMNDPTPRSPEVIQEWIDRLAQHRDWMRSRADSLKERSAWFYRQAEEKAD
jgi:hypothetical protein